MKAPSGTSSIAENSAQTTAGTVTPTPIVWRWQIDPLNPNNRVQIADQDGTPIAEVESIKSADYVLLRLNSYDDLLAALNNHLKAYNHYEHIRHTAGREDVEKAFEATLNADLSARAAISKATLA